MLHNMRQLIMELVSSTTGALGVIFLGIMVFISIFALIANPIDFGTKLWNNPSAWADNPKNVPPMWTKYFNSSNKSDHIILESDGPDMIRSTSKWTEEIHTFTVQHESQIVPSFTSFSVGDVTFHDRPPIFTTSILRPDGRTIDLYRYAVPGQHSTGDPIRKYQDVAFRVHLTGDPNVSTNVATFSDAEFGISFIDSPSPIKIEEIVFGTPKSSDNADFDTLRGTYTINIAVRLYEGKDTVGNVKFVLGGTQFGLMGTDSIGRDLARGLLFGFPIALGIGVITSVIATMIGTTIGIASGYIGGTTDILIQRLCDILSNIPLLPILMFLAFILGQKLWIVILILILFGWPGMTILIRSMVLHMRSGQLIEATESMGASRWRVMFRHIFPQVAPFVLAQMIFFTPAAILAEAGLSFLGLGDPSIPTWGQILDQGFRTGAIYVGFWWWVLPPGLLIVATALAFVLIALGMERIVDPRLRNIRQ